MGLTVIVGLNDSEGTTMMGSVVGDVRASGVVGSVITGDGSTAGLLAAIEGVGGIGN